MLNVGVDIHKRTCQVCLKDERGSIVEEFRFRNNQEGASRLATVIKKYGDARVALESTGNLWVKLYDRLDEEDNIDVILTNPKKTRVIAEAKIKNDKLDARLLADLVRAGLVARSYVPPRDIRMQRALLRERISLVESRTMIKNHIHALLDKYEIHCAYTDLFGKKGREWLRSVDLPTIDQTILEVGLQRLEELEAHIDAFTDKIAQEAVENPQAKLLMSFTGIDYYSAMLLASEIGDVTRFASAKKLVSYAGLAPGTRQSADKTIHGHIVREGNKRIRWILVEAAQHASRHDPRLRGFYLRILKRRGYQRAIVAVARKMLVSMYHLLSKNEVYHGVRGEEPSQREFSLVRPPGFGPGSLAFFPVTGGRPLDALLCPRPGYPHVHRPI
jgi:transposase